MRIPRSLGRALFFLPLFAPLLLLQPPDRPLPASLLLGLALGYARTAAFLELERGIEELMLGAAALPFGFALAAYFGAVSFPGLLLFGLQAALTYALLYVLERLYFPRYRGFALLLGFLIAFALLLALAALLPATLVLGGEVLALGLAGYFLARRAR